MKVTECCKHQLGLNNVACTLLAQYVSISRLWFIIIGHEVYKQRIEKSTHLITE